MKSGLNEIIVVTDKSASMFSMIDEAISGINTLIEDQKKLPGECYYTEIQFNNKVEVTKDHINLKEIEPHTRKTYITSNCTALNDAIGTAINTVGKRLADTPESERPEKVIFVIMTDGVENASNEFNHAQVKEMIETQTNEYAWDFLFLANDLSQTAAAVSIGITRDKVNQYNGDIHSGYAFASRSVSSLRT